MRESYNRNIPSGGVRSGRSVQRIAYNWCMADEEVSSDITPAEPASVSAVAGEPAVQDGPEPAAEPPVETKAPSESPLSTLPVAEPPAAPVSDTTFTSPVAPEPQPVAPVPAPTHPVPVVQSIPPVASPKSFLVRAIEAVRFRKRAKLEKIVKLAAEKGSIVNDDVEKLVRVSHATATRYLAELVRDGRLRRTGASRTEARYEPAAP